MNLCNDYKVVLDCSDVSQDVLIKAFGYLLEIKEECHLVSVNFETKQVVAQFESEAVAERAYGRCRAALKMLGIRVILDIQC